MGGDLVCLCGFHDDCRGGEEGGQRIWIKKVLTFLEEKHRILQEYFIEQGILKAGDAVFRRFVTLAKI